MTSTAEEAAGAKSVAEARPLGVQRTGLTAATAVVPADAKSVGVGEASRQKSVGVEQLMQRLEERQERTLRFFEK